VHGVMLPHRFVLGVLLLLQAPSASAPAETRTN
jgi:hypothetical protein